ncbi:MAG: hypothetical protein AAF297_09025 [Planctomycetota bacterium]
MDDLSPRNALLNRLRRRTLAIVLAGVVASVTAVSVAALPVLPVVGVALITVAAAVHSVTAPLKAAVCSRCGASIAKAQPGPYGAVCASCGGLTPPTDDSRRA